MEYFNIAGLILNSEYKAVNILDINLIFRRASAVKEKSGIRFWGTGLSDFK
jgi:hypothetical protein